MLKSSCNKLVSRLFSDPSEEENKLSVPKPRVRVSVQPKLSSVQVSKNKKTVSLLEYFLLVSYLHDQYAVNMK